MPATDQPCATCGHTKRSHYRSAGRCQYQAAGSAQCACKRYRKLPGKSVRPLHAACPRCLARLKHAESLSDRVAARLERDAPHLSGELVDQVRLAVMAEARW